MWLESVNEHRIHMLIGVSFRILVPTTIILLFRLFYEKSNRLPKSKFKVRRFEQNWSRQFSHKTKHKRRNSKRKL